MTSILRRALVAFVLSALMAPWTAALADSPRSGDLLSTKFTLIEAASSSKQLCDATLQALNRPTVYDPNDLHSSLLVTGITRVWEIIDRGTGRPRAAHTFGEYRAVDNRGEFVQADLDHDGAEEDMYRIWLVMKGQTYTEVSLSDDGTRQPVSLATLTRALQDIGKSPPESSFFLIEIFDIAGADYLIALETVESGIGRHNRLAYVAHLRENMSLAIDCMLKTTSFED